MSNIRTTYSGLISFSGGIVSIITGLIFTLLLTRSLLINEYGTWGLISGLFFYVLIIEPVTSYWTTREIARNINSGKTSIITNSFFSLGGISIYLIIAYFMGIQTDADVSPLLFSSILIPVMFVNRTLNAINLGWKPHVISFGRISLGISQIIFGIIFVYYLNFGINGIIISVFLAYLVSISILFYHARNKLNGQFDFQFLKYWIKFSWLPIYPGIATILRNSTIVVFTIFMSSVEGLAFWIAAVALTVPISQTSSISTAVYSKLLHGDKTKYIKENLSLFFYFSIPVTSFIIIFSKPGLFLLNPIYEIAYNIVIILAIQVFLNTIAAVFDLFLEGNEKVDVQKTASFKDYFKSKLFLIPTILIIRFGSYLVLLTLILLLFSNTSSQMELLIFWSYVALFTQIPFTFLRYILFRKTFKINLDFYRIIKFGIISIGVSILTYLLMEHYLIFNETLLIFIPRLLMFVGFGIGLYIILTFLTDFKTRYLINQIILEFRTTKK